jgi:hypothetical protein
MPHPQPMGEGRPQVSSFSGGEARPPAKIPIRASINF